MTDRNAPEREKLAQLLWEIDTYGDKANSEDVCIARDRWWLSRIPDESGETPCNIDCSCQHPFIGKIEYRKRAGTIMTFIRADRSPAQSDELREALEGLIKAGAREILWEGRGATKAYVDAERKARAALARDGKEGK